MPQITAIEPQKSTKGRSAFGRVKKDRFNLFIDGSFASGISVDTLLSQNLKVGKNLTEEDLQRIVFKEESAKLMDSVLRFLSYRPRSEKETVDYLAKRIAKAQSINFSVAKESLLVKKTLQKLQKYNFVNDKDFSKWLVKTMQNKRKGPIAAKVELFKKGISKELIQKVIENYPNTKKLALLALEKKIVRWKNLPSIDQKKKAYQFLLSRGFDWETTKEVFASLLKKS